MRGCRQWGAVLVSGLGPGKLRRDVRVQEGECLVEALDASDVRERELGREAALDGPVDVLGLLAR